MEKEDSVTAPILLAIHICDSVIRDETTKKMSLIGLFNRIQTRTFPTVHPSLHVYVSLTNGHKVYEGELRFVNEKDSSVLFTAKGKVPFQNPLQNVELNFAIRNLKFNEPGNFSVEFYCDGKFVGNRKFIVSGLPPSKSKETFD